MGLPVFASHNVVRPSILPLSRYLPSGEYFRAQRAKPLSLVVHTVRSVERSHTCKILLITFVARRLPSGENVTPHKSPFLPLRIGSSEWGSISHSSTVPFAPP